MPVTAPAKAAAPTPSGPNRAPFNALPAAPVTAPAAAPPTIVTA
ncbi:hypothetical protein [Bartonella krasnovii]|nr:hypothetical protein [Bartonella krasnovii]